MFKVLKTFSGMKVSASAGSEIEITDKAIVKDLLRAGYIEPVKHPDTGKTGKKAKDAPAADASKEATPTEAEAKDAEAKDAEAEDAEAEAETEKK